MTVVGAKIDVIFGTWAQTVQHDVPAYILPKSSAFKNGDNYLQNTSAKADFFSVFKTMCRLTAFCTRLCYAMTALCTVSVFILLIYA